MTTCPTSAVAATRGRSRHVRGGPAIPITKLDARRQAERGADRDDPRQRARKDRSSATSWRTSPPRGGGRQLLEFMAEYKLEELHPLSQRSSRSRAGHAREDRGDSRWRVSQRHPGRGHRRADGARLRGQHQGRSFEHRLRGHGPVAPRGINVPICYTRPGRDLCDQGAGPARRAEQRGLGQSDRGHGAAGAACSMRCRRPPPAARHSWSAISWCR